MRQDKESAVIRAIGIMLGAVVVCMCDDLITALAKVSEKSHQKEKS